MSALLLVEPGRPPRRWPLAAKPVTIGSLGLCTIKLSAAGVSHEHLRLERQDSTSLRFEVLGTAPAVRLNGVDCRKGTLRSGDRLEVGGAILLLDPEPAAPGGSGRTATFEIAEIVFQLAEKLVGEKPAGSLLAETLDVLLHLFGASRALLLSIEPARQRPRVIASRGEWPEGESPRMSHTLLTQLVKNREPVLVADVTSDPTLRAVESIALEIRSIVAGPVLQGERMVGIVYLESSVESAAFGEPERLFLQSFCRFAAGLLTKSGLLDEMRIEKERLLELHVRELQGPEDLHDLVGESAAMHELRAQIAQVAPTDVTVLVLGESGTGKELVSRAVHRLSPRRSRPLVALNCTALPEDLAESELFGHVAGSFSGATQDRRGRFELAHTGTLFLDEVGDLSLSVQAKLLRALQEKVIQRVGDATDRPVDVRIVAATNANLVERIKQGRFREDLYFRLNVFSLRTPPLRERQADIPLLARHFLSRFARQIGKKIDDITPSAMETLSQYSWPGNIRELGNLIQQASVRERSDHITPGSLFFAGGDELVRTAPPSDQPRFADTFELALRQFEVWFLGRAWKDAKGDPAKVMKKTGLPRATLYRKCAQLGLDPANFRAPEGE